MKRFILHKLQSEDVVTASVGGLSIEIDNRRTRCGEYAYDHLSTKNNHKVTCKRCLKGLAKDARES